MSDGRCFRGASRSCQVVVEQRRLAVPQTEGMDGWRATQEKYKGWKEDGPDTNRSRRRVLYLT